MADPYASIDIQCGRFKRIAICSALRCLCVVVAANLASASSPRQTCDFPLGHNRSSCADRARHNQLMIYTYSDLGSDMYQRSVLHTGSEEKCEAVLHPEEAFASAFTSRCLQGTRSLVYLSLLLIYQILGIELFCRSL